MSKSFESYVQRTEWLKATLRRAEAKLAEINREARLQLQKTRSKIARLGPKPKRNSDFADGQTSAAGRVNRNDNAQGGSS